MKFHAEKKTIIGTKKKDPIHAIQSSLSLFLSLSLSFSLSRTHARMHARTASSASPRIPAWSTDVLLPRGILVSVMYR